MRWRHPKFPVIATITSDSPSLPIEPAGAQPASPKPARPPKKPGKKKRNPFWTKQLHLWHWMSSAICLVGMLLFAITGITLNHASQIEGSPAVVTTEKTLPADLRNLLTATPAAKDAPLPAPVAAWASKELSVSFSDRTVEWNDGEVYIGMPQPGGDGWVSFDTSTGAVTHEHTDRGWISWLNDLHKGRNAGSAWSWFLDIFAVACVIFSMTGFFLLQLHAKHRPSTWPLVGAGVILPLIVILIFVHR